MGMVYAGTDRTTKLELGPKLESTLYGTSLSYGRHHRQACTFTACSYNTLYCQMWRMVHSKSDYSIVTLVTYCPVVLIAVT